MSTTATALLLGDVKKYFDTVSATLADPSGVRAALEGQMDPSVQASGSWMFVLASVAAIGAAALCEDGSRGRQFRQWLDEAEAIRDAYLKNPRPDQERDMLQCLAMLYGMACLWRSVELAAAEAATETPQ